MGWIQMLHDRDWRGAEASYRRALELAPGNAMVLHRVSLLAGLTGRLEEAITLARRAVEQDPLSAASYFFLGTILWSADRHEDAIAALRKSLELAPQRTATHGFLSVVLLDRGRAEEALAEALQEPEDWGRLYALAIIHHAAGRPVESEEALQELIRTRAGDAAYQIAEVHAARGETNRAFEWLERARVQRDAGIAWAKVDPHLRSLHVDPRWAPFLQTMGLAD